MQTINAIEQKRDVIFVQPTSWGNNICFEVAALTEKKEMAGAMCSTVSFVIDS